jgi:ABC-2 type transport system ATP-binding protein
VRNLSFAPMIEVSSLTKRFGPTLAVDGLSFGATPARVLGFLGPNGAGKTTTLRTLLGLTLPTSGSATVDGRPYRELSDPVATVGAVLEGPQFHPGRTGRNHLRVLAAAAGLPASRVDEVLRLVELDGAGGRRVKGYSLGMRQRLSLAGALLGDPRALVLDEPANGLDPQGIRWLRDFLGARAADGRTVLISSHVLAEVAQTVDEVVVISRGRLVAQGSLEELTRGTAAPVWVRSPDAERLRAALAAKDVAADADGPGPDWLSVRDATLEVVGLTAAEHGIPVFELYRPRQSLEDVFLELTSGTEAGR